MPINNLKARPQIQQNMLTYMFNSSWSFQLVSKKDQGENLGSLKVCSYASHCTKSRGCCGYDERHDSCSYDIGEKA